MPAFIIALLLGLGIPIGLLYVFKWRGAMIPGQLLQAVLVPIEVVDGEVLHAGEPLTTRRCRRRSGESVPEGNPHHGRRRRAADQDGCGRSAPASSRRRSLARSARPPQRTPGKTGAAKLPLAVHNTWAVFHDPAGDPATARLLVLRGFDLERAARTP